MVSNQKSILTDYEFVRTDRTKKMVILLIYRVEKPVKKVTTIWVTEGEVLKPRTDGEQQNLILIYEFVRTDKDKDSS